MSRKMIKFKMILFKFFCKHFDCYYGIFMSSTLNMVEMTAEFADFVSSATNIGFEP